MSRRKNQPQVRVAVGSLAVAAMLAGCRVGPPYHPPAPPAVAAPDYKESPIHFQDNGEWKVASAQDAMIRGKWWEVFNDPGLNALEDQLNIDNQNIKAYFERLMAARSVTAQARAQYWPTVAAAPSFSRQQSSGNVASANVPAPTSKSGVSNAGREVTLWSMPLEVAWEPDFWSRIRNQVHEAQYASQVSAADLEVERLTEQASLAEYYFQIRGQDALQGILDDTVTTDQKSLQIARDSYSTGLGNNLAVAEAKTALDNTRAAAISLHAARAQYEHAIATLIGKPAADFNIPVKPLLTQPPPIPVGVPSQLLERRPDVAAAERTLAEDNAVIGIGYGAYYPSVTLAAEGGYQSSTLQHLFDWPSRFWSIGPSISETAFNGGLYKAQVHQYIATYNADLAAYRQTVLTAFQQVEDYLAATRVASQQIEQEQLAVKDSQHYLDLEMGRYKAGLDPYVDVVTAQTTALAAKQALAADQIAAMTSTVQLIAALGGGWDRSQLPSPSELSQKAAKKDYALQK